MAWKTDTIENYYCTDPLIKGKWNQGWPANKYTPNSVAGCTPLAVAQAMTYVRPRNILRLNFPEKGDKKFLNLNWDAISNHTSSQSTSYESTHFYECNASDEAHEQIACLVREIGYVFGSDYKIDDVKGNATGTLLKNVHNKIQYFFPDKKIQFGDSFGVLWLIYENNNIAIVSAGNYDENGKYDNQHSWVVDGKALIYRFVITYYDYVPATGKYSNSEVNEHKEDQYFHFRWGWGGLYDGYYLYNILKPGCGVPYVYPNTTPPTTNNPNYYKAYQDYIIIK